MVVRAIALPRGGLCRRCRFRPKGKSRFPYNTLPSLSRPSRAFGYRGCRSTVIEVSCGASPKARGVRWLPELRSAPERGDWSKSLAATDGLWAGRRLSSALPQGTSRFVFGLHETGQRKSRIDFYLLSRNLYRRSCRLGRPPSGQVQAFALSGLRRGRAGIHGKAPLRWPVPGLSIVGA
jgi:hypothetical protein